ncbi:MAG: phosphoribulokinase [Thermoplasmatota archaeon]
MDTIRERLESIDAYIILGIGGDSGAGKTTFSRGIRRMIGEDKISGFSMDDYHKEDRKTRKITGHLPLDPQYNHLDLLAEHLADIRKGKAVVKPVYNHKTGELDPQVVFQPKRITIVEGLHPFYTYDLRERMDMKIFVDPVRDVKWKWKLQRDVEKRGHQKEDAFKEILAREPYFKLFIDVQKVYSDIVVRIEPSRYPDQRIERPQVKLIMADQGGPKHHLDINFDLSAMFMGSRDHFALEFWNDYHYGKRAKHLTVDGSISKDSFSSLEERICSFTGTEQGRMLEGDEEYLDPSNVVQLIVAWWFLEKLHNILSDLEGKSLS